MSFAHVLYQTLIGPLQLLYQFVFYYAFLFTKSTGVAIITLSLVMNFLLLPLYRQADAIQDKERLREKQMEHWVKHIKKTFSGNERFMMLQTYYRQNNYKPYYSLSGILPLLLEVPFFIAAYYYLSGLTILAVPFGPIRDMSAPDTLIDISGFHINLLPILMTIINLISGAIYTKGLRLKDKLQLYGMAVLFLVLLYDSPSGLVIYWTMNNLFSLIKNIICRLKKPRRAADITISMIGLSAVIWGFLMPKESFSEMLPMLDIGLCFQLPLLLSLLHRLPSVRRIRFREHTPRFPLFLSGCIFLTLLTGVLIPSAVITSSPIEFVSLTDYQSPLLHILNSFLLAAGVFLAWFGLLYYLSGKRLRWLLGIVIWIISGTAVINYMFFNTISGTLSAELKVVQSPTPDYLNFIINLAVLLAAIAILFFVWKKSKRTVQAAYGILCLVIIGMSGLNIVNIHASENEIQTALTNYQRSDNEDMEIIHLSKNKKNVIVLMLDRAISSQLPYIFQEKPELKEQFSGFTYYPNTLSFGMCTNFASPALYGGYEYTPAEINARSSESLVNKHNEALKVMPVIFDENNYQVTVIEPTYAGYSWVPELEIYDDYPDIHAYNIEEGQMNSIAYTTPFVPLNEIWERNFFCYSLMKISPCFMQSFIYHDGTYYSSNMKDISTAFLNSYAVMCALPSITVSEETQQNTFLMMSNSMTHEPELLKEPEYIPTTYFDNQSYDLSHQDRFTCNGRTMHVEAQNQMMHYHVNMAAMLKLGEWFDYLRKNGVYDNTRIIIVADHGSHNLCQFDDTLINGEIFQDVLSYNPLLLVKDFNSRELTTDMSFMTNADVPTLAFEDLIVNPINPFTRKAITNDAKLGDQYVIESLEWNVGKTEDTTFPPSQWYSVHDNIFNLDNWEKSGWH